MIYPLSCFIFNVYLCYEVVYCNDVIRTDKHYLKKSLELIKDQNQDFMLCKVLPVVIKM